MMGVLCYYSEDAVSAAASVQENVEMVLSMIRNITVKLSSSFVLKQIARWPTQSFLIALWTCMSR